MIDTKELRLNNWVLAPGQPHQIGSIGETEVMLNNGSDKMIARPAECLEPIVLSPELLARWGFAESYQSEFHTTFEHKHVPELTYRFWHNKRVPRNERFAIFTGERIDCDHLHQLQNLFYSLTGEELTQNP